MMDSTIAILLTLLIGIIITPTFGTELNTTAISNKLDVNFYKSTCPNADKIVTDVIKKHAAQNPGIVPGIIRLHFHDCYVSGCDGSILLTPQRYNSYNAEQAHPANGKSLRGMDAIEAAKAELEKQCPGVVSCADILAYAARDTVVIAGNPRYEVPAGRRDSFHKDGGGASALPKGNETIMNLEKGFAIRGLTVEDLVVLEASHSVGQTRCLNTIADPGSMSGLGETEKVVDKAFQQTMKTKFCQEDQKERFWNLTAPLVPEKPDNSAWGVSYYDYILKGKCLLPSDIALGVDASTKDMVQKYAKDSADWQNKFNEAMIKVGKVNVLTGNEGEIRKTCKWINAVDNP